MTLPLAGIELDPYWFPCDGPLLGVPHGANVLTNAPFLVLGLWGLWRLQRAGPFVAADRNRSTPRTPSATVHVSPGMSGAYVRLGGQGPWSASTSSPSTTRPVARKPSRS